MREQVCASCPQHPSFPILPSVHSASALVTLQGFSSMPTANNSLQLHWASMCLLAPKHRQREGLTYWAAHLGIVLLVMQASICLACA